MEALFTPYPIRSLQIPNRFVRSATFEAQATPDGQVSDALIKIYRNLARGEVGLIIASLVAVHPDGRAYKNQLCLGNDATNDGLRRLVDAVHEQSDSKVFVQLMDAGRQGNPSVVGWRPKGPSAAIIDPMYFYLPRAMSEAEIERVIDQFVRAAVRCREAGADGVQLHAAHTYLVSQFLSPFLNRRRDRWGGSAEGRFRLLREIMRRTRAAVGDDYPIITKLNSKDHTPLRGVDVELAARYARWLMQEGIDAIEVSAGSSHFAYMNMCRGRVPTAELLSALPMWKRPLAWLLFKLQEGRYDLEEGYNFEAAARIKREVGDTPLILVGGLRSRAKMSQVLASGVVDFVSQSRPFLRQPNLVKRLRRREIDAVSCCSCNNCLAAVPKGLPVRCYVKGLP